MTLGSRPCNWAATTKQFKTSGALARISREGHCCGSGAKGLNFQQNLFELWHDLPRSMDGRNDILCQEGTVQQRVPLLLQPFPSMNTRLVP